MKDNLQWLEDLKPEDKSGGGRVGVGMRGLGERTHGNAWERGERCGGITFAGDTYQKVMVFSGTARPDIFWYQRSIILRIQIGQWHEHGSQTADGLKGWDVVDPLGTPPILKPKCLTPCSVKSKESWESLAYVLKWLYALSGEYSIFIPGCFWKLGRAKCHEEVADLLATCSHWEQSDTPLKSDLVGMPVSPRGRSAQVGHSILSFCPHCFRTERDWVGWEECAVLREKETGSRLQSQNPHNDKNTSDALKSTGAL